MACLRCGRASDAAGRFARACCACILCKRWSLACRSGARGAAPVMPGAPMLYACFILTNRL